MLPSFRDMLAALIACPSVSCAQDALDQSNDGVIANLATWCESLGFKVRLQDVPNGSSAQRPRPRKLNLLAQLGSGEGGIVLAGHTDTVPFNAELWTSDPFRLRDDGDRLFGLGTCDMKGFFPLALMAVAKLDPRRLKAPIYVVATADEESSMAGAIELLHQKAPAARYAVIGEPTDLAPVFAHKGMMMMSVQADGRSGHSSMPHLGLNALDAMHMLMGELIDLRRELAERYRHEAFVVTIPTMNFGCIRGGDAPNRICGAVELQLDVRIIPGMNNDDIAVEIDHRMARVADVTGVGFTKRFMFPPLAPYATPRDSAFVQQCERASGQPATTAAFGTEAPFLQQLGCETVVLGPGHVDQAHQPDEFMRLDRVHPTVAALEQLLDYATR